MIALALVDVAAGVAVASYFARCAMDDMSIQTLLGEREEAVPAAQVGLRKHLRNAGVRRFFRAWASALTAIGFALLAGWIAGRLW